MKINVIRVKFWPHCTMGVILKDEKLIGFTLEPEVRKKDDLTSGKGAIPKGVYNACFVYSQKFKKFKIRLLDVPGFEGILIHEGNKRGDTNGCILVGKKYTNDYLLISRELTSELEAAALRCKNNNEEIIVKVSSIYDYSSIAVYAKYFDIFDEKKNKTQKK